MDVRILGKYYVAGACIGQILHIMENSNKARHWRFIPNTNGGSGKSSNPSKILQSLSSFKLGNTKLLYKYEHFFFSKTGKLITNWVKS